MRRRAAWQQRKAEVRLARRTLSHSASVMSGSDVEEAMPTQCTRTVTGPSRSAVLSNIRSTSAGTQASVATKSAGAPAADTSRAACSPRSR